MAEVASAYVTLLPSAKGFAASTSKAISGDLGKVGTTAGKDIGEKAGKGISGSLLPSVGKLAAPLAAAFAALGVGKFIASAVKDEEGFSTTIRQIGVAADVSGTKLDALRSLAIKTGADTVFSAQDAAAAELELAKGGITPAVIAGGALQATMSLASAGQLDLADSAGIVSAAMHTFGINASHASQIADSLAGGANASSADVSDLAQALTQVGSGAQLAGLNLDQTVGVLSALADKGIKGSDAGTSLKTMLQRLIPASKQAGDEMKKLGLNFVTAKGNFLPIDQVAQQLKTHLDKLTQAQRENALQIIFGQDAVRAAAALYTNGAKGIDKYISATEKTGNAAKLANASLSGTSGALSDLSGSFDTAKLAVGTFLAPTVVAGADLLTTSINRVTAALQKVKAPNLTTLGKVFTAFYDGITGKGKQAAVPLTDVQKQADKAEAAVKKLVAQGKASPEQSTQSVISDNVTAAINQQAKIQRLITAKQVAPAAAKPSVTGIGGTGVAKQVSDSDKAVAAVGTNAAKLKVAIAPLVSGLLTFGSAFVAEITKLGPPIAKSVATILPVFESLGKELATTLGPALSQIGGIITSDFIPAVRTILPVLAPVAALLLKVFGGAVIGALQGALTVIKGVLLIISGVFDVFGGILTGKWSKVWTGLKLIVSGTFDAIGGLIKLAWNVAILTIFDEGWAAIRGLFEAGDAAITALWKGGLKAIQDAPKATWSLIKGIFRDGISGAGTAVRNGAETMVRFFGTAIKQLAVDATKSVGDVLKVVRSLPGKVKSGLGNLGGLLVASGKALIDGLAKGITSELGAAANAAKAVASKIKGFFPGSPVKEGPLTSWNNGATGKKLVDLLSDGIRKATPSAVKSITNLAEALGKEYDKATASLADKINQRNQFAAQLTSSANTVDFTQLLTPSIPEFKTVLKNQLNTVKSFSANMKKLIKDGLNKTTLTQLANAGPDSAGAAAAALAKGGKSGVAQINSLQSQLGKASKGLGTEVSNDLYSAGVNAAKGLVAGLKSEESALEKIAGEMGKKIAKEVRKALGIHSPSTEAIDIASNFGGTLTSTLADQTKPVGRAAFQLGTAIPRQTNLAVRAPSYSSGQGGAATGSGTTIQVGTVYGFTPDSLLDEVDARERRRAALAFT